MSRSTEGRIDAVFRSAEAQSRNREAKGTSSWVRTCAWVLLATGLVTRLSPLLDVQGHLYWQYMSEDGYLMQAIARNMAIGLGMSTSNGTIPTNGVQPLATFLFAGLHLLAGGSKLLAIAYVTIFSTLVSLLAAGFMRKLGQLALRDVPFVNDIALLAAASWFASPLILAHSMNGLETCVYYAALAAALAYYFSLDLSGRTAMRTAQRVALGLVLGIAFLARNDAVFFIAALLLAHAFTGGESGGGLVRRSIDALIAAAVSLVVAAPWLIHNRLLFGSIVPISGKAESHGVALGANLRMIPANLVKTLLPFVPIPQAMEQTWLIVVASIAIVALSMWAAWALIGSRGLRGQRLCLTALLFSLGVCGYYGLFFGAAWFVSRYLSALSPLLWLLTCASAYVLMMGLLRSRRAWITCGSVAVALMVLSAGVFAGIRFAREQSNGHRQVVEWAQKNVDDQQWIGAIQTGTLGYFHDRTLNLDGKVNPKALRAQIERNQVLTYVLDDTPINYLVDWIGIASWVSETSEPRFGKSFEIVVKDERRNLAALRRIVPVPVPVPVPATLPR